MHDPAAFLFDVEGTLVGDKRYLPIEGAVDFVAALRNRGLPLCLITNNTTDRPVEIIDKLRRAGFDFALDELLTCTCAAVALLRERGASRALVIGSERLQQMIAEGGIDLAESDDVDAVVVGLDTSVGYARLQLATEALVRRGALLVALHRNKIFTDAHGRIGPSVGALVALLSYAADADALVVGKPSEAYFRQALQRVGVDPGRVMVVSDDPFSDLAGAKRLGMQAAFVLTGKYPDREVLRRLGPEEQPDRVAKKYSELGDLLR